MKNNPYIGWVKTKANNTFCRRCQKTIPKGEDALVIEISGPKTHRIKSFFCFEDGMDILKDAKRLLNIIQPKYWRNWIF